MTIQANTGFGVSVFGVTGSGGGGSTSPGGSTLQIQYNNAGSFGGMAGTSWDNTNRSLTLTGATITASNPVLNLTQTWNAAGVTFTGYKLNITDTASNAASLLMDFQVGGSSKFSVNKSGSLTLNGFPFVRDAGSGQFVFSSNSADAFYVSANGSRVAANAYFGFSAGGGINNPDVYLLRRGAANIQLGLADAAAPVAQTLSVQSVVAGTSNTAGANLTITGSQGTGTGAGGSLIFQVAPAGSSGTAQNALANAMVIDSVKTVRLGTGYTVATLPAAGTAGRRTYVTDALAPTYLGALTGGGSVVCPVFDNGTAWVSA